MTRINLMWLVGLLCLGLVACSDKEKHADLHNYMHKIMKRPGRTIAPLPKLQPYRAYRYSSSEKRSPFDAPKRLVKKTIDQSLRPDMNRPKEPLEAFGLDSLQMVGTVKHDATMWALVSAPDGEVYPIAVGSYVGKNYGRVIAIQAGGLTVKETVPDHQGGWKERDARLDIVNK